MTVVIRPWNLPFPPSTLKPLHWRIHHHLRATLILAPLQPPVGLLSSLEMTHSIHSFAVLQLPMHLKHILPSNMQWEAQSGVCGRLHAVFTCASWFLPPNLCVHKNNQLSFPPYTIAALHETPHLNLFLGVTEGGSFEAPLLLSRRVLMPMPMPWWLCLVAP